jgi:hypothetical protein
MTPATLPKKTASKDDRTHDPSFRGHLSIECGGPHGLERSSLDGDLGTSHPTLQ